MPDLMAALTAGRASYQRAGHMYLRAPRAGDFEFFFYTSPVYESEKLRREIDAGRLRRNHIAGYQENLWDKAQRFVRLSPSDNAGREIGIDADGSVSLECRDIAESKGLIAGNVREGFSAVSEREGKDPVLRAVRGLSAVVLKVMLERLDPSWSNHVELKALPYDILDQILANEETRLRAAFLFLRWCYWEDLTQASQEAVAALEREWFPQGFLTGAAFGPALPFVPLSDLVAASNKSLEQI